MPSESYLEQTMVIVALSIVRHPLMLFGRFIGRYNTMVVFLFRPSPQVPKPSVKSAIMCYDASAYNIKAQAKQLETAMVDITWIFLLSLFMAVNTILWTISYPEVRSLHSKGELEEHIDIALEVIEKCRERWPGTAAASHLYSKLAKACLRSYDSDNSQPTSSLSATSPSSFTDANSPSASEHSSATTGSLAHSQETYHSSPPTFGYIFDEMPEQMPAFTFDGSLQTPQQPSFRSNSIFVSPSSIQSDRRFSYFPPDFAQPQTLPNAWSPVPLPSSQQQFSVPALAPVMDPTLNDVSYFMQSSSFSFGPHLYAEPGYGTDMRHGSLSQEQQIELMQSLETDGLSEIEHFMNISSQQYENSHEHPR